MTKTFCIVMHLVLCSTDLQFRTSQSFGTSSAAQIKEVFETKCSALFVQLALHSTELKQVQPSIVL